MKRTYNAIRQSSISVFSACPFIFGGAECRYAGRAKTPCRRSIAWCRKLHNSHRYGGQLA
jgi:hypothetical protein